MRWRRSTAAIESGWTHERARIAPPPSRPRPPPPARAPVPGPGARAAARRGARRGDGRPPHRREGHGPHAGNVAVGWSLLGDVPGEDLAEAGAVDVPARDDADDAALARPPGEGGRDRQRGR